MTQNCPVCTNPLHEVFRAVVLQRHEAIYDHCDRCGFLRIRAPHWLDEAYADSIAITDTGLLLRNMVKANQLAAVCKVMGGRPDDAYLDFAGGYGVLTRLMRDIGFNFYWMDIFSKNLLATGFEYTPAVGPCRAVTAFEVMEHVQDPCAFVTEALDTGQSDTLIFSTELYAGAPPRPGNWWYYSVETGQHIAFYRRDTLQTLADRIGLHFHTHRGLHFLSRKQLPTRRIDLVSGRLNRLFAPLARRSLTTRTLADHELMKNRLTGPTTTERPSATGV